MRAYAHYMKQTGFPFSMEYIAETLSRHLTVAEDLVALFHAHFDPQQNRRPEDDGERLQPRDAGSRRSRVSGKPGRGSHLSPLRHPDQEHPAQQLLSARCGRKPQALSLAQARAALDPGSSRNRFRDSRSSSTRYAPRGCICGGGRVARGGVRWSDRQQDYRTEILGLVKAQQVKNAVIVPVGAKGGFVARRIAKAQGRDAVQQEGIACYRQFIQGLLDVTDNYVDGQIVSPADLAHRDDPDPYLVVAADKGTATFSDIANEISWQYDFWLGDAFASGGSIGYDHKKMGITARGAWVSVATSLSRDGRRCSGGVHLRSGNWRHVGRCLWQWHVALRPDQTRRGIQSLAHLPRPQPHRSGKASRSASAFSHSAGSAWPDYDTALISEGGGVYPRSAKSIPLSPEVRASFDIEETKLDPNRLISALLKTPAGPRFQWWNRHVHQGQRRNPHAGRRQSQ